MGKQEIAKEVDSLLDNYVGLRMSHIAQDPYIEDCWELFIKAPRDLPADELVELVKDLTEGEMNEDKWQMLEELRSMWHEWKYALDKIGYHGRQEC